MDILNDIEGLGTSGVHVKVDTDSYPCVVATFDGDERVSEWKSALQEEDEIWLAKGYLKAKENYREPYQNSRNY